MEKHLLIIPGLIPEIIDSTVQLQSRINEIGILPNTPALMVELSFMILVENCDLKHDLKPAFSIHHLIKDRPTLYYSNGKKPTPKYDETGWPNKP